MNHNGNSNPRKMTTGVQPTPPPAPVKTDGISEPEAMPPVDPPVRRLPPHGQINLPRDGIRTRDVPSGDGDVYPEPYMTVSLFGCQFQAMVDTGAVYSVLGNSAIEILRLRKVPTTTYVGALRFAGGQMSDVVEQADIYIAWHDGRQTQSNMIINIRRDGWFLEQNPLQIFRFGREYPQGNPTPVQNQNGGLGRIDGAPNPEPSAGSSLAPAGALINQPSMVYKEKPFICVSFLGFHTQALLDTGSTGSIVGKAVIDILRSTGVPTRKCTKVLGFAGGQTSTAVEEAEIDMTWHDGRQTRVTFLLLPTLNHPVLLARNFIHESNMIINIRRDGWALEDDPFRIFQFDHQCSHFSAQHNPAPVPIRDGRLWYMNGVPNINPFLPMPGRRRR